MRVIVFFTLGQSFVQKLKDVLELLFKYIFASASKICTKGKGCLITRTKYTLTLLGTWKSCFANVFNNSCNILFSYMFHILSHYWIIEELLRYKSLTISQNRILIRWFTMLHHNNVFFNTKTSNMAKKKLASN